ncbi:hypothetical protein RJ639_047318 [Escallonia herrerae]|uniref:60S ribosomal export protein NMD3 n=1 Tax=Escallonia herrerae TaxID=1293975 RepID=A0AA88W4N4_9ASTE|nr:hypothetical protein RJ639_047318 [Escallonia herrerae]
MYKPLLLTSDYAFVRDLEFFPFLPELGFSAKKLPLTFARGASGMYTETSRKIYPTALASFTHCTKCDSYFQPPRTWIKAEPESRELMTYCLKSLKRLDRMHDFKIVTGSFCFGRTRGQVYKKLLLSDILYKIKYADFVSDFRLRTLISVFASGTRSRSVTLATRFYGRGAVLEGLMKSYLLVGSSWYTVSGIEVVPNSEVVYTVGRSQLGLAIGQIVRVSDGEKFSAATHLGHYFEPGNHALGYDLPRAEKYDARDLEKDKDLVLANVALIKRKQKNMRKHQRAKEKISAELNPELRFSISLNFNKECQPSETSSTWTSKAFASKRVTR